jgi:diguanylate cyclase (GGDEF)-like protein
MLPVDSKKLRNQYLLLYFLSILISGAGSFIALNSNYAVFEKSIKDELVREANITNVHLEASITSAQSLLEYNLEGMTQKLNDGKLTDALAYQVMHRTQHIFREFNSDNAFKLTLYIDERGLLRATSEGLSKTPIDLSDRLYFQALKKDPHKPYAIGDLEFAKTTGLLTFHLSSPIKDRSGKFRGVVAQQFVVSAISENLIKSLDGLSGIKILVHVQGGNVTFAYPGPLNEIELHADVALVADLSELIQYDAQKSNAIIVSASNTFAQGTYLGYVVSDLYKLETSVFVSKKFVFIRFINQTYLLLVYIAFAFIALTIMIWLFYRYAIKNALAMQLSHLDPLTNLINRRALDSELPTLWKESIRSQKPISALFIDIDHFKIFNDSYGHECGDTALKAVASTIKGAVNRPLDLCCRWGGEEFVVVLPNTDERGAISLANTILAAVRSLQFNFMPDINPQISVSIGVATMMVTESNKTDDLIDMADKAMYMAKQKGRDGYVLYGKSS